MNVFILGANGFIGNELIRTILKTTTWKVCGIDLQQHKVDEFLGNKDFTFKNGDINKEREWVVNKIFETDVVIPLSAIATPKSYVDQPIAVFQSVFETNLWIIKECVRLKKRLVFPSTSEVYGMCSDELFSEKSSPCVLGPIEKERWIYSCSKQLLDRVIWAYGKVGLQFTLFRPFNWIGHSQDSLDSNASDCVRVLPQFIGNVLREEPIYLVNGGNQTRSFTDIKDGIDALMRIIKNNDNQADRKIFNIGNKNNNASIRVVAETVVKVIKSHSNFRRQADNAKLLNVNEEEFYGSGYQDVLKRVPDTTEIQHCLGWKPSISLEESIKSIISKHLNELECIIPDSQLKY